MAKIFFNEKQVKYANKPSVNIPTVNSFQKKDPKKENNYKEYELNEEGKVIGEYQSPSIEEINSIIINYKQKVESDAQEQIKEAENKKSELIQNANDAAENIKQQAEEYCKEKKMLAEEEGQKILKEAKEERDKIIADTKKQEESIQREGYNEGYKKGFDEAYKEAEKGIKTIVDKLNIIVSEVVSYKKKILDDSLEQMLDIILLISKKVIKDEIDSRRNIVLNNLNVVFKRLIKPEKIIVRLNLDDIEFVSNSKEAFLSKFSSIKDFDIIEDSRIEKGGVIVETNSVTLDARIALQLQKIEESLRDGDLIS